MAEPKASTDGRKALTELIRKEIRSETNRRFLAGLPGFRADMNLPDELQTLLRELDRAERRVRAGG